MYSVFSDSRLPSLVSPVFCEASGGTPKGWVSTIAVLSLKAGVSLAKEPVLVMAQTATRWSSMLRISATLVKYSTPLAASSGAGNERIDGCTPHANAPASLGLFQRLTADT